MRNLLNATVWVGMAAIVLTGAAPARADEWVAATVPFEFIAGHTLFPAGRYVVAEGDDPTVLSIKSVDGRLTGMVLTIADAPKADAAAADLRFVQFGGEHFLAGVTNGDGESRAIPLTPKTVERALIRVEPQQRAAR